MTSLKYYLVAALSFLLVHFPLTPSLAQQKQYSGWCTGPGMMGGWGMGWFGMLFMAAFWILLIVGLVFFVKWLIQATSTGKETRQGGSRALDILNPCFRLERIY